jgi:hypothetical protein
MLTRRLLGQTVSTVNEATRLLQLTQVGLSCMMRRLLDQNCFNSQCSDAAAAINTGWSVIYDEAAVGSKLFQQPM